MESRQPFSLSLSLGVWGGTSVRVSLWLIFLLPIAWGYLDWQLGTAVFVIIALSVLFHEFCHIWVTRYTGGEGDEILLWPFGGLAYCRPADTFRSEFWTACAGPLSNLLLAVASIWPAIQLGVLAEPMDLARQIVYLPEVTFKSHVPLEIGSLIFSLNWKLFWLNLLPVYPLDGGRMLQAILVQRMPRAEAHRRCIFTGLVVCFIAVGIGFWVDDTLLVFIGCLGFMTNRIELLITSTARHYDDSFMGHDFSEGYTSLERDEPVRERQPGYFERRRIERERKKRQKEEQIRVETENRVDQLLEKISTHGMESLTHEERRFLEQASQRNRHNKPL